MVKEEFTLATTEAAERIDRMAHDITRTCEMAGICVRAEARPGPDGKTEFAIVIDDTRKRTRPGARCKTLAVSDERMFDMMAAGNSATVIANAAECSRATVYRHMERKAFLDRGIRRNEY